MLSRYGGKAGIETSSRYGTDRSRLHVVICAEGYPTTADGYAQFQADLTVLEDELERIPPFESPLRRDRIRLQAWLHGGQARPFGSSATGGAPSIDVVKSRELMGEIRRSPEQLFFVLVALGAGTDLGEREVTGEGDSPGFIASPASRSDRPTDAALSLARAIARRIGLEDESSAGEAPTGVPPLIGVNVVTIDTEQPKQALRDGMPRVWEHVARVDPGFDGPWTGGAGRKTSTIRYAEHCLMRRSLGEDGAANRDFCALCSHHLRGWLAGTYAAQALGPQTSSSQVLKFHKVYGIPNAHWPTSSMASSVDLSMNRTDDHLTCTLKFSPGLGMTVSNLKAHINSASPAYVQDIAKTVEFRNLTVTIGGVPHPFDTKAAMPTARFYYADQRPADAKVHCGALLVMDGLVGPNNNPARVRVELSLVLRGKAADFDPAGAGYALKFWPQIGFTQLVDPAATARVEAFHGEVMFDVLVPMPQILTASEHHHHHGGSSGAENLAAFYTDANGLPGTTAREVASGLAPLLTNVPSAARETVAGYSAATALWHGVFDYARTNIQSEIECLGVAGMNDPPYTPMTRARKADLYWPRLSNPVWPINVRRTIHKVSRQGSYDNLHIHGSMGSYPNNMLMSMIMAPVCAHACFHLHWRWSAINNFIDISKQAIDYLSAGLQYMKDVEDLPFTQLKIVFETLPLLVKEAKELESAIMDPSEYRGWEPRWGGKAGWVAGQPLAPSNQTILVALTKGTTSSRPSPSVTLDADRKTFWFKVDAIGNIYPDQRHVIGHAPVGLAYSHIPDSLVDRQFRLLLGMRNIHDLKFVLTKLPFMPADEMIMLAYEMIRFIDVPLPNKLTASAALPVDAKNQVIPDGTVLDRNNTALEAL